MITGALMSGARMVDITGGLAWRAHVIREEMGRKGTLYISGYVQGKKGLMTPGELARSLDRSLQTEEISDFVKGLYGNFGLIYETPEYVIAVADRIRSVPIFYREAPFIVAASAVRLLESGCRESADLTACSEFLLAGYVTGKDTLFEDIKQLQAGEFMHWSRGQLTVRRYYSYPSDEVWEDRPESDLIEELDAVHKEVFGRIIGSLEGRAVMVPLSGGLDSRLVVAMLRRLKYDNVSCFAFGKAGHWEVETSRRVAQKLCCKWMYFPYNHAKWKNWFGSKEYEEYFGRVNNFFSLPPLLEWPSVLQISKEARKDLIFMPGHTGDYISGGHLLYLFEGGFELSTDHLFRAILQRHFTLWSYENLLRDCFPQIRAKMMKNLHLGSPLSGQVLAAAYERWEWRERQAKYIVNHVRSYECYGFDWRIPLWDPALMDFWSRVPLKWKTGKKLYRSYLAEVDPGGVFKTQGEGPRITCKQRFKQGAKSLPILGQAFTEFRNYLKRYGDYWNDNIQMFGLVPYHQFILRRHRARNVNAFFAKWYLRGLYERFGLQASD